MFPLLKRYSLDPRKGLGQNFLIDHQALKRIVASADLKGGETVLEIGAGLGSLTRLLACSAKMVKAVEIDNRLIPALQEVVREYSNVEVIQGDILQLDPRSVIGNEGYIIVGNIPYYITSAITRHLFENPLKPSRMVLTMQKEVAERICAQPGDLSLLALSVQVYGEPFITTTIPATAFYPQPSVDSATLRVDLYQQPFFNEEQRRVFFELIHMGFAQKRKTLRNTLSAGLRVPGDEAAAYLKEAGIDPQRRAQSLNLVEWKTLVDEIQQRRRQPGESTRD